MLQQVRTTMRHSVLDSTDAGDYGAALKRLVADGHRRLLIAAPRHDDLGDWLRGTVGGQVETLTRSEHGGPLPAGVGAQGLDLRLGGVSGDRWTAVIGLPGVRTSDVAKLLDLAGGCAAVVHQGRPAARPIAVALHKSGTNLLSRLLGELGYEVYGQGVHETLAELATAILEVETGVPQGAERRAEIGLALENVGSRSAARLFSESELKILKASLFSTRRLLEFHRRHLKRESALIVHEARFDERLATRLIEGPSATLLHYRDPRDTLVSFIRYVAGEARGRYSPTHWNQTQARILNSMATDRQRLEYLIRWRPDHCDWLPRHVWLFLHPEVCNLSFEQLVGRNGGGSDEEQLAAVARAMVHLRVGGDPREICSRLYDRKARTFRRGTIGGWRKIFPAELRREFAERYGHALELYGYPT